MRKLLTALVLVCMFLTSCSKPASEDIYMVNYEAYTRSLAEATKFVPMSRYYSVSGAMSELPDGTYRYYVFVDEPKIAMIDVVVLAVENGMEYTSGGKMMPSSGIWGDPVSMIPNQINKENGFVKGIMLNGECSTDHVDLKLLVEWKDRSRKEVTREFIELSLSMEDNEILPDEETAPEEYSGEDTESGGE